MKVVRIILGALLTFLDRLFSPRSLPRSPGEQAKLDERTRSLSIYQFQACPFCIKVRRHIKRLGLKIELKDAKNQVFADELLRGGGSLQVPCLKIQEPDGSTRWMYESADINLFISQILEHEMRDGRP